jgi:UDP-glucuronate 4-epimerase
MSTPVYLVTGALGCIGAWTLRNLVREGMRCVALDLGDDPHRLRLIMTDDEIGQLAFERVDITDLNALQRVFLQHAVTHVIHLAGLQVPFCRANPTLGAQVNVVGTVNVFEAARRAADTPIRVVYASSAAVFDVDDGVGADPVPNNATGHPATLYGVYKQATEGVARVYFKENKVSSIGLRPYVVYGAARDQGLTSAPTKAMHAAALGEAYHIGYGGRADYEYTDDVARTFIACTRVPFEGAQAFNVPGRVMHMSELIKAIETASPRSIGKITFDDTQLPFPEALDGGPLDALLGGVPRRPVEEAVVETIQIFREALASGRLRPAA